MWQLMMVVSYIFDKVGEDLINKFNYVAGIIPVVKIYVNELGRLVGSWNDVKLNILSQIESAAASDEPFSVENATLAQQVFRIISYH